MSDAPLNGSQVQLLKLIGRNAPEWTSLTGAERSYLVHAAQRLAKRGLMVADRARPRWYKLTSAGVKRLALLTTPEEPQCKP